MTKLVRYLKILHITNKLSVVIMMATIKEDKEMLDLAVTYLANLERLSDEQIQIMYDIIVKEKEE